MSVSEKTSSTNSLTYDDHHHDHHHRQYNIHPSSSTTTARVWEIEEEISSSSELFEVNHINFGGGGNYIKAESSSNEIISISSSLFSLDGVHTSSSNNNGGISSSSEEDCVYVGVGKDEGSSVDALSWTLKNVVGDSTTTMVCLVHVFPETHHIPSPLGKLPKSQVRPEQVEIYMAQERGKRRELLQKFINMCTASKVKVDTVLIESDMVAKAFLDLIPILNMNKLVLGTSKSSLRKIRSKRGGGLVEQILQNAPELCEIKVICEGKEVKDQMAMGTGSPSPRGAADHSDSDNAKPPPQLQVHHVQTTTKDSFACMCFKSPRVM